MKRISFFILIATFLIFAGCHKKHQTSMPEMTQTPAGTPSEPQPQDITQNQDATTVELDELTRQFQPVFFDYNKSEIRDDQITALQSNAGLLKKYSTANVLLEGHCDERGTDEYNLALGERRAKAVRDYLVNLGISGGRLETISYGESRPFAEGHTETSWQQNRRAQSVVIKVR